MKIAQVILTVIGAVFIFIFSPAASDSFNGGNILGMSVGVLFSLFGIFLPPICRFFTFALSKKLGIALLLPLCLALLFAVGLFVSAAWRVLFTAYPAPNDGDTVIVLGCQVKGDTPGPMLTERLDTALEWLSAHPDSLCVVSGGQGPDEGVSEAEAMRKYLTDRGIDGSRIFTEDRSESTEENIRFSRDVISENKLSARVILVTQGFHRYRTSRMAQRYGLEASFLSAPTSPLSYPVYFLRETCGVMLLMLGII